jgi:hypothetical protein
VASAKLNSKTYELKTPPRGGVFIVGETQKLPNRYIRIQIAIIDNKIEIISPSRAKTAILDATLELNSCILRLIEYFYR